MKKRSFKNQKGFSLAEAMIAAVVLSIAAAGVLLPFTSGARVRVEGVRRTLGAKLASDQLEQVLTTSFDEIIAIYDGYSELEGQVKETGGAVFTDARYSRFSRDVSCEEVYVPQESGTGTANFILVTVRVYYGGKEIASVNRLVSDG